MPRLADPNREGKYEISRIQDHHREIVRMIVLGYQNKEIADHFGMTPMQISYIRNSRIVKRLVEDLNSQRDQTVTDIQEHIADLAPIAIETIREALVERSHDLPIMQRVKVAQDLLDRNGNGKINKVEATVTKGYFDSEQIAALKKRAIERGLKNGSIIDASIVQEDEPQTALIEKVSSENDPSLFIATE